MLCAATMKTEENTRNSG